MKKLGYLKNILFNSAILILIFIATTLIVSSGLLLIHIGISKISFIVSGVITLAVYFLIYRFLCKEELKNKFLEITLGAVICLIRNLFLLC